MKVYKAINTVQAAMSKVGISKDNTNQQQGYKFRGIDDVYSALAPLLAGNNLVIIPRCVSRVVTEKPSKSGGILFYVAVGMEYDIVSSEDGSKHTASMAGEAMDSGDKATNKAVSAAYKYMCFQTFCIPTEGDNDADNHAHEVAQSNPKTEAPKESKPGNHEGHIEKSETSNGWTKVTIGGMDFSTKKEEIIKTLIEAERLEALVRVKFTEQIKGRFTNRYIDIVEIVDKEERPY